MLASLDTYMPAREMRWGVGEEGRCKGDAWRPPFVLALFASSVSSLLSKNVIAVSL